MDRSCHLEDVHAQVELAHKPVFEALAFELEHAAVDSADVVQLAAVASGGGLQQRRPVPELEVDGLCDGAEDTVEDDALRERELREQVRA